MALFRRLEVLNKIISSGLVPIFYEADPSLASEIFKACAKGGAEVIEMTNRGDQAIEVFKVLAQFRQLEYRKVALGVGSIVDAPTAALYINAGADFIVGPVLDRDTAILCNKRKIAYLPGCATASEIHEAESLGVEICKIFPADLLGGPEFVKALKAPCPWISLMPTGGVEPSRESLSAWFKAGVVAVGIGSKLISKEIVRQRDFQALTEAVKITLSLIAELRQEL